MPCNPSDVSISPSDGFANPIPGFGRPFSLDIPNTTPFPDGFPEDLLEILDNLQMLIPPGILKPALNPNFGKDIFDGIMKLLDQFLPFLMLYKFFLPLLNLIICIIEVLCAIPNPFKLIRAMRRLFRTCIPQFLNLFPVFALIIMIISLLLLLLALIQYILAQILKFIEAILRNINALFVAFSDGDENSILAITQKLGSLLCIFQNLFVLLSLFNLIIEVIRDLLSLAFSIPPCDNTDASDFDGCCTPDVCPEIIKSPYTRTTGVLQYVKQVNLDSGLSFPVGFGNFNVTLRNEMWQIYDIGQETLQQFINITDAADIPDEYDPKPIFFPTDSVYNSQTNFRQAPYTVDMRLFYDPALWGRVGTARFIRFNNCIVTTVPQTTVIEPDNTTAAISTGVLLLAGGQGYEDDNTTLLTGFAEDGITGISSQATLENFFHAEDKVSTNPVYTDEDGYEISSVEYTFKPNLEVLLQKQLITLGCEPSVALNREFINTAFGGDIGFNFDALGDIVNRRNGRSFPDPAATQEELQTALDDLRGNMTPEGVADFQNAAQASLDKLNNDTESALGDLITLGVEPCNSTFLLTPTKQFTTKPIIVKVELKERNGVNLATGISQNVANDLIRKLKGHFTLGELSKFTYDGYSVFTAEITSKEAGTGQFMMSFDNDFFCVNNLPANNADDPSQDLVSIDYTFINTPTAATSAQPTTTTGTGDTSEGVPRRDAGDVSRDNNSGGS